MEILFQFGIFWFCFDSVILARVNSRVKYLYYSEGETVFLKCKSIVNSTGWVGPAQQNESDLYWVMETDIFGRLRKWNTSLFTSGEQINPSLSHKNKLKLIYNKETGNTILRIQNFSKSDEGLYICDSSPPNGSVSSVRFILQKKNKEVEFINVFPSTTIILRYNYTAITVDWTGPNHDNNGFISEEKETDTHSIKKKWNVTTYTNNGHFNRILSHKKRLKIVGDAMRGQFFLQIENVSIYDVGLYRCHILSEDSTIFLKSFIIQIKQLPELTITYEPFLPINEGNWFKVCCYSNGTVPNQTLQWLHERHGMQGRYFSNMTCFYFENIKRNDNGVCTCIAEYGSLTRIKNITVRVYYSPSVRLIYRNYTQQDSKRTIVCKADGQPMNYTYRLWEHKSMFNEHIRYLTQLGTGVLTLPFMKKQNRYQDSGIYVCSVSNGVPDMKGVYFKTGQAHVVSKGPPVFVESNHKVHFGTDEDHMNMNVYVYSLSNITCSIISNLYSQQFSYAVQIQLNSIRAVFFGKIIRLHGHQVLFTFPKLTKFHFQTYVVTVCNMYGNNSFHIELKRKDGKQLSSHDITIKVLLVVIAVLVVGMGICFWNVGKQRYRKRIITTLNMPAPEENGDESAHYMEIIDDNILTTSQENNNPIISTADINVVESRNIDLILDESSSASSDNDNNASGHMDDGYEKPYTTLLVLNQGENKHDYLTTRRKSSNENPSVFATDAFGTTSMYETKTHDHPNARYENVNLKSEENKAEYINLSLKQ